MAMGVSGLLYYQFSIVPMKNKLEEQAKVIIAQDLRDQEQRAAIESIQYEAEMSEYLDIFRRHNIAKLASAKPGMIETRINNATKEVFDAIENDSDRISSLND